MKWLKSRYHEAPVQGLNTKRVKFANVQQELQKQFAPVKVTAKSASQLLKSAFPCSENKSCGKSRQKHICGIQMIPSSLDWTLRLVAPNVRKKAIDIWSICLQFINHSIK